MCCHDKASHYVIKFIAYRNKTTTFQNEQKTVGKARCLVYRWKTKETEMKQVPHTALRRCGDVVTTSLCTSQQHRRQVPNETPNDVSMERHQDVSVGRIHDVFLECGNDVSKGHNNDVLSVRLHDVSEKYQMKHPTASQWYVTKTSQWYVSTTSHQLVSTTSPVSHK